MVGVDVSNVIKQLVSIFPNLLSLPTVYTDQVWHLIMALSSDVVQ